MRLEINQTFIRLIPAGGSGVTSEHLLSQNAPGEAGPLQAG